MNARPPHTGVGVVAILVSIVVFIVPFVFIVLDGAEGPEGSLAPRILAGRRPGTSGTTSSQVDRRRATTCCCTAFINSIDPDRRERRRCW